MSVQSIRPQLSSPSLAILTGIVGHDDFRAVQRAVVAVSGASVHGQCGRLAVRLAAVGTAVGFGGCVHHVMLVQTAVLGKTLPAVLHSTDIWLFT